MFSLAITIIFFTANISGKYQNIGQSEAPSCSCTRSSVNAHDWVCKADDSKIVEIKENNLLTTCNLDENYEVSFDLFIIEFKKKRNILNILTTVGNDLISVSTRKRKKIRIKGMVKPHVLKLPLGQWNSLKISQEKHGNFVSE